MSEENKIKIGITTGDLNGIGMEVIIKTFMDVTMMQLCTPIVYGSSKSASFHRKALGVTDFNFTLIKDANQASIKHANLLSCWEEEVPIDLGKASVTTGKYALKSIETAIEDLKKGKIAALVTAPINKQTIHSESFKFAGHTEYLAEKFETKDFLMLLVSNSLRVGVVTGHIPVSKISSVLTSELIYNKIKIIHKSLKEDFGINKPRIAVLGLNPHAGDNGLIGDEEQKIIIPAINKAKEENILAFGPYSADGFFGSENYKNFDAILAMYHDQGLIPFKTLAFGTGINFTAGLPIVRTSPDHGTGYDIAGKNIASEDSFRQAIYLACDVYRNRIQYKELSANPLKISNLKRE